MANFAQIRQNIQYNLGENGIANGYYSVGDINNVLQDAYNMVAVRAQFYTKRATINQVAGNYYNFAAAPFNITDYMGTVAIFNSLSNLWLRDDVSLRDFSRIRRDWELWTGNAQFWAPHSFNRIAITPYNPTPVGTFTLIYWALPPSSFQDTDVPIIASDMQVLLEEYCTADLLESAKEYTKAADYWQSFENRIEIYKKRSKELAKLQLLMRI